MKGIGFFEQNIEKIVLVVMALVFLAVLAMQFTLQPNQVEVGGQTLPPERAFNPVATEAERLSNALLRTDPPLPEAPVANMAEALEAGLDTDVAPHAELPIALGPRVPLRPTEATVDEGSLYAELVVPAPTGLIAHAYASTLNPVSVKQTPGLAALVPASQPFDKSYVSVEATLDGEALAEAAETDPDGDEGPLRPFPLHWRSGLTVLGVQIERQLHLPDGTWGEAQPVAPAPGEPDLLGRVLSKDINGRELALAVDDASTLGTQLLRPDPPPVIAGERWKPPALFEERSVELTPEQREIERNVAELDKFDERIERIQQQIEDLQQRPQRDDDPRRSPAPRPGSGGRGGAGGPSRQPTQTTNPTERKARSLQAQLERFGEQREQVLATLTDLGWSPNAPDEEDDAWRLEPIDPLTQNPATPLWAHDMRADPGAVYRYRARVAVNNPAFGRGEFMVEEQKQLADSPVVFSEWSGWSDPVDVLDDEYYFITSATEGGGIVDEPAASVEVYRFYYGYWRRESVRLEPGDVIATAITFPNPDELRIYDISGVEVASNDDLNPPPDPYPDPRSNPRGLPQPPGRGYPNPPGVISPPTDPRNPGYTDPRYQQQQQQQRQQPKEPALNLPFEPGPSELPVEVDAILLDVALWPSAVDTGLEGVRSDAHEVFLRDTDGRIVSRRPDLERQTSLYRMVSASAREAERREGE